MSGKSQKTMQRRMQATKVKLKIVKFGVFFQSTNQSKKVTQAL